MADSSGTDPQAMGLGQIIQQGSSSDGKAAALTNAGEGITSGANLAIAFQTHQQNMQIFQDKQQQFQQSQADWLNQQMGSVLSISNPTLRVAKFNQVQKLAQSQGLAIDPGYNTLMKDNEWVSSAQQAHANMNGLPYTQGQAARMDLVGLMGNAAEGDKVITEAGQTNEQYKAATLNAQVNRVQMDRTANLEWAKMGPDLQTKVFNDNKETADNINNANLANSKLLNPGAAGGIGIAQAKAAVDRVLGKGIVRPQTAEYLSEASNGIIDDLDKWLNEHKGPNGKLTEDGRQQLLSTIDEVGRTYQLQRDQRQSALQTMNPYIDSSAVYAGQPQYVSNANKRNLHPVGSSGVAQAPNNTGQVSAAVLEQVKKNRMQRAAQANYAQQPVPQIGNTLTPTVAPGTNIAIPATATGGQ